MNDNIFTNNENEIVSETTTKNSISWTPSKEGTYDVKVSVTDKNGESVSAEIIDFEVITKNTITVYYSNGNWSQAYIHYKVNNVWTTVPGVKMQSSDKSGYTWMYTIELEDVSGMLKSDAQAVLKEKKLKVKTEYVDDEEVEIDKVVKTDPVAKSMVKAGDEVTLYISRGKEDGEDTLVPDVRKLTKTKAKVMLEEAGLTLGNVEEVYDDTVEEGKIISQEYTPNDKLPIGTSVSVVISKGPKPTETTTPKETTTEKPTTSKKEDTTQEPSTTAAPVYTASVNLRLSDILQKLEVDEEGRYNGAGVVGIKVDGAWYNGFDYTDINSWPDEWTLELPESDTKKKSTVEVYVDSMSTPIYTVKASYK